MKKIIAIILAGTLAASLCGCFPLNLFNKVKEAESNIESKIESEIGSRIESEASAIEGLYDSSDDSSDSSDSGSSSSVDIDFYSSDLQTIGNDDVGYLRIPKDFIKFKDIAGGDDLQYCDRTTTTIFTLNKIDKSVSVTDAIENIKDKVESEGAINATIDENASLAGFSGSMLKCYYPSDGKHLEVYIFPFPEKNYYIAFEYLTPNEKYRDYLKSWETSNYYD